METNILENKRKAESNLSSLGFGGLKNSYHMLRRSIR